MNLSYVDVKFRNLRENGNFCMRNSVLFGDPLENIKLFENDFQNNESFQLSISKNLQNFNENSFRFIDRNRLRMIRRKNHSRTSICQRDKN